MAVSFLDNVFQESCVWFGCVRGRSSNARLARGIHEEYEARKRTVEGAKLANPTPST